MPEENGESPSINVGAIVSAVKEAVQADIEGIKSSFDARFDKVNTDVESLFASNKSGASTEMGKKIDEVAERRQAEENENRIKQTAADRDNFWQEYNSAVYEEKLPKEAFEGFTTAAEIKRQTAVLKSVLGINQKTNNNQPNGGIGSGEGGAPSSEGDGLSKQERTAQWLAKHRPMRP